MGLQRRGLGEEFGPLVGVQAYNPSAQDEEAGGLQNQGQPGLHRERS